MSGVVSLHVYFKELTCNKYRREVILTWDGLLATLGSVVSLCLGGSLISLIEIVYYFTFQLFVAGRRAATAAATTGAGRDETVPTVLFKRSDRTHRRNVAEFVRRLQQHNRGQ